MSAAKRRAGMDQSPEFDAPDSVKRRRKNDDTHYPDRETITTTTEIGLKLIRQLKNSKDKTGRYVAGHFIDLPDKRAYPQYYEEVKLPMSLNMVEQKLQAHEYATMEHLESDLKRLVQNAKEFNSTKSEVYEDAERIRKALSNFMPKHNPAYLNPSYRAYPTPIPRERLDSRPNSTSTPAADINGSLEKLRVSFPNPNMGKSRKKEPSVDEEGDGDGAGLSEAQVNLVDQMMELPNSENFFEKPSKRQYPEYYKIIARPTALADIRKSAEKSRYGTWDAFFEEVRLIWKNAKEFNEEDSEIYRYAEELETWFEAEIRKMGIVPPKTFRFTLNAPAEVPRIKLKFGSQGPSVNVVGGSGDSDSTRRQRSETANARPKVAPEDETIQTLDPQPTGITTIRPENVAQNTAAAPADDITQTSQGAVTQLPAIGSAFYSNITVPPTPQFTVSPAQAGSQHAGQINLAPGYNNAVLTSPFERTFRDPGKGMADALLGNCTFMTSPRMADDPKWKLTLFPSSARTQTRSDIWLPADHYYIRVKVELKEECFKRNRHRLVVCRNWEQLQPLAEDRYTFDFRIYEGNNDIVIDLIADLKEGDSKPYAPPQLQLDFERRQFGLWLRAPTPE